LISESVSQTAEVETAARRNQPRETPFPAMVALFAVSGAAGLIDQVCFSKYLGYVVGGTAHAVSAVLAAFMTGLSLGAWLGGRWAVRVPRPLAAYGVLELCVAAAVALTPFGFRELGPLYSALAAALPDSLAAISVLRWFVAFALVVVPTTAMGATLPLVSRGLGGALGEPRLREQRLNWLYAANTLGGACGALLAAYVIVPEFGLNGTVLLAAGASAVAGVAALLLDARARRASASNQTTDAPQSMATAQPTSLISPSRRDRLLLDGLAYGSGFLVFAAEVVSTHLLALIIGNSAYAFGLILAAFLAWLFAGAWLAGPLRRRFSDAAVPLGLAATALAALVVIPLWDDLPRLFASLGTTVTTFTGREAVRGAVAFAVLAVPTTAMGLTFPLLLRRVGTYPDVSRWVGRLTAINTIGAVSGALATGYFLLPALGSQGTLIALGIVFGLMACAALPWAQGALRKLTLGAAALSLLLALALPRWDLVELTSGSNVYFEAPTARAELVSLREDAEGGVTSVTLGGGVYTLYTNGKFQGNTGWEMEAQRLFAHYPSMFVEHFDRALVIGLGTGTTLGTLAAYPWKQLDVAEISPAIAEAAGRYFRVPNRKVLDDPRVRLHIADGRNYLLVKNEKYDLISMELSSIWFAGASSLYTHEFYELARTRLKEDGIFQQWMQLHHVYRRDFASVVNTLRHSFRHVALFYGGRQGILVASQQPLQASKSRLERLEQRPDVLETEPHGRKLASLIEDVLVVDAGLDAFLDESAADAGVSRDELLATDENLYLEYRTPLGNVLPWEARERLVAEIQRHRDQAAIDALLVP
jgi:spermidine synthase